MRSCEVLRPGTNGMIKVCDFPAVAVRAHMAMTNKRRKPDGRSATKVPPKQKERKQSFCARTQTIDFIDILVAPSGIEPELFALRGRRVNQLHHGARGYGRLNRPAPRSRGAAEVHPLNIPESAGSLRVSAARTPPSVTGSASAAAPSEEPERWPGPDFLVQKVC